MINIAKFYRELKVNQKQSKTFKFIKQEQTWKHKEISILEKG